MGEMKSGKEFELLLERSPKFFTDYFDHCRGLKFKDQPDYRRINLALEEEFKRHNMVDDGMFDWLVGDTLAGGTLISSQYRFDISFADTDLFRYTDML